MNAKSKPSEPRYAVKVAPKIKTVGLQVGITDLDLEAKIKTAFALVKSAGRELDLTFGIDHSRQTAFSQLRLP